jgi:general secretion pathway protein A
MYKDFFALRENPFNINPDPRYLFLTPQTQESLDQLTYGIHARKGLMLLTGDVGTGKTTLINRLLDWLRQQQTPTAFIFNSHLEVNHLFDFILADFGLPFDSGLKSSALMRLNQWLLERYRAGETPVLIVDEAQGLATHVLEEIRMLLNLETSRDKLLQIVLAGQPALEERLKRPELRQVKQRIALRCKTAALTLEETHNYIQARLHIAGANGKPVFASEAIDAVNFYSRGIPRVINLLCENALISAYVENVQPVPENIVAEVARAFQLDDMKPAAPSIDSRDVLGSNLIAMQSTSMENVPVSPPASAEPPWQVQAGALTAHVSAPSSVAGDVLNPVKEFALPIMDREKIPDLHGDAEACRPSDVLVTMPSASGQAPIEPNRASELTAFFSDLCTQFNSESEMRSARLAFYPSSRTIEAKRRFDLLPASSHRLVSSLQRPSHHPTRVDATKSGFPRSSLAKIVALHRLLARWEARWADPFLSTITSLARTQRTAILFQRLNRSFDPVRTWYRRYLAWQSRCLTMAGSIDWPRIKGSIHRWLWQPWRPIQWRLPGLHLFEARRRFSYKKP